MICPQMKEIPGKNTMFYSLDETKEAQIKLSLLLSNLFSIKKIKSNNLERQRDVSKTIKNIGRLKWRTNTL